MEYTQYVSSQSVGRSLSARNCEIQVPGSFAAIYYIMHASHFSIPDPSRDRSMNEMKSIPDQQIDSGSFAAKFGMARETHAVLFAARDSAHAGGAQPCHHPCWEVLAGRVGVAQPPLRAVHSRASEYYCWPGMYKRNF